MPTTNTGMPAAAAAMMAAVAGPSSAVPLPPPAAGQFGRPSVASRMYLGFASARPIRYVAPAVTAARVGVLPLGLFIPSDVMTAAALLGPIMTSAPALTPQPPAVGKYFRPQLTLSCVAATTMLMPATIAGHFCVGHAAPPPGQSMPSACWFIEPDLSR